VNQYKIFHFMMVQLDDQSIFYSFKSPLLLTNEFFINKQPQKKFHDEIINLDLSPN
jgi:hypothetical protein